MNGGSIVEWSITGMRNLVCGGADLEGSISIGIRRALGRTKDEVAIDDAHN